MLIEAAEVRGHVIRVLSQDVRCAQINRPLNNFWKADEAKHQASFLCDSRGDDLTGSETLVSGSAQYRLDPYCRVLQVRARLALE